MFCVLLASFFEKALTAVYDQAVVVFKRQGHRVAEQGDLDTSLSRDALFSLVFRGVPIISGVLCKRRVLLLGGIVAICFGWVCRWLSLVELG